MTTKPELANLVLMHLLCVELSDGRRVGKEKTSWLKIPYRAIPPMYLWPNDPRAQLCFKMIETKPCLVFRDGKGTMCFAVVLSLDCCVNKNEASS